MNRLANFLVRRRWPLFALPLVVAVIPLVAVSPDGGGSRAGIVVFAAGVALFAVLLGLHLSGRDPDAEARGRSLDPDPIGAALLTRWLSRSKYFRFVGGTVGAILGVGFVDGSLVPVLLGALAGIVVGGGLAEVHALRRPRSGPRNADISIRRFADYTAPIDVAALAVAGGGAVLVGSATLIVAGPDRRLALAACCAAAMTVIVTLLMQWRLVVRPRPALSADLRRADDLMRRLAATRGFARPGIALAMGLLAASVSTGAAGAGAASLSPLLWVLTLIWYVTSRQARPHIPAPSV